MRIALVITGLMLAGCQVTQHADWAGRVYPPECRGDLSYLDVYVALVAPNKVPGFPNTIGYYQPFENRIYVANNLSPELERDVIHHELCHRIAGGWHE